MSASDFQEKDTPNPVSWLHTCGTSCLAAVTYFLGSSGSIGREQLMAPCRSWVHIGIESTFPPSSQAGARSSLDRNLPPMVLKLLVLSFRLWPSKEAPAFMAWCPVLRGGTFSMGILSKITRKRAEGVSLGYGSHDLSLGCSFTMGA